jgi:iron complex outermembrane receptor protein
MIFISRLISLSTKLCNFALAYGIHPSLLDRSTWAWTSTDNGEALPNYIRVDGALGWKNDKFAISLNINNIMNAYLLSGSRYSNFYYWQSEPGRNFRLSVTYNF